MFISLLLVAVNAFANPETSFEPLGAPCISRQVLAGRAVTDRATGRELFVLTNMNEISRMELIFIDYAENTGRVFKAPAGDGSWALNEVVGDRLVVGTYYDGMFMTFDLNAMKFVNNVRFDKEEYIWNLALGGDGKLYGGTYPGGRLGALDLTTYTVEDCGAPAPPNLYLRNVSETPDGRIFCSFGTEKPISKIYDPTSKTWLDLPAHMEGIVQGCSWGGLFLAGAAAFAPNTLEAVPAPYPIPENLAGGVYVDPYLTLPNGPLFLRSGNAVYRFNAGEPALTLMCDIDLRGGRLLAASKDGKLLGVRGQDYFVINPGDTTLTLVPIPGEVMPRRTHFLKCDPEGRVWGGPTFGQTLFYLDPATKVANNTGQVCDGGGEVYDVTFWKGKTYAAAYSGGDIVEYDPAQPWDQWNFKNPRPVATVRGEGFIRPTGGISTLEDGRLVSGWMAAYGTYGGLIAITDPTTGASEFIKNPLGEQAISGVGSDGAKLFVTTTLGANGLENKKGENPRFGVIDIATKKVEFMQEFAGSSSTDRAIFDRKTGLVAFTMGSTQIFDPRTNVIRPVGQTNSLRINSQNWVGDNEGHLYYGHKSYVVQLNLENGVASIIGAAPGRIESIALHPSGDFIVNAGPELYRVNRK